MVGVPFSWEKSTTKLVCQHASFFQSAHSLYLSKLLHCPCTKNKLKQATMASSFSYMLLFSAAILLSVAAASTNWCEPGLVIPLNPLQSCHAYLVRRTCGPSRGPFAPLPVIRERCCRELEDIVPYCRCGALRVMVDAMPLGGGGDVAASPSCSWDAQLDLAATLVSEAECNLVTRHGRPFCYALGAEGTTTSD